MSQSSPLISVILITYNQENYIKQAINSVLTQQCDFSFELIIGDDCSTDRTQSIIGDYLNDNRVVYLRPEQNLGPLNNEEQCIEAARGKYIAFLEGDDFWNNPFKLQNQVSFLEANPDYSLVHGDVNHLIENTGELLEAFNTHRASPIINDHYFERLLFENHYIKTMTTCFKKALLKEHFQYELARERQWGLTDLPIWLIFAHHGQIHYLPEVVATYRLRAESTSRTRDSAKAYRFHCAVFDIKQYYCNAFGYVDFLNRVNLEACETLIKDAYNMSRGDLAFKYFFRRLKLKKRINFKLLILSLMATVKGIFKKPAKVELPAIWES